MTLRRKPRLPPALLCTIPIIALMLLWVSLFAGNNAPDSWNSLSTPPSSPDRHFLVRRDPHTGRDVRVMVSVVSTHMTMAACMNVASGYLSGIPIYVAGYHSSAKYNHTHKVRLVMEAARKAGLGGTDVVFFVDSDTVFTGPEQFLSVVDGFIAESASSAEELDARAVREGRVRAPMIVSREPVCYSPQSLGSSQQCANKFNRTNQAYNEYTKVKGIRQYVKQFSYMNSGTYISRFWAFEEFAAAFYGYMQKHPTTVRKKQWSSDQAIFNALYLDLRSWEVRADALSLKSQNASLRSQYGLRAGLLEVDERWELATVWLLKECVLSNEFWLQDPNTEVAITESPFAWNYDAFTAKIYNQYKQPLRRYPLPPTLSTQQFFGHAVPPTEVADHGGNVLLATVPRRAAPAILHAAGGGLDYLNGIFKSFPLKRDGQRETLGAVTYKFARMTNKVPHLSWYIPLKYNATRMANAKAYLSELYIPLISEGIDTMESYQRMCVEAFVTSDTVYPPLYRAAVDTYNLFFDYHK